jgi:hypothetical protein
MRIAKSKRLRWAGYAVWLEENRNVYRLLVERGN